jgi:RHS repeat-associated protein
LIETNDYTPWGLSLKMLESKAVGRVENRYKYNGKEEQCKEFGDGSGLDWFDYGAWMYDQQIGRWGVIDLMAEKYFHETPYNYAGNNSILLIDIEGKYKYPSNKKKNYEHNYKQFMTYLENQMKTDVMNSDRIKEGLKRFGQFKSDKEIENVLTMKNGPTIEITAKPDGNKGARGKYQSHTKTIQINSKLVEQFENAKGEDKQAALLSIFRTLLHETAHYGDYEQKPPDGDTDSKDKPCPDWDDHTANEVGNAFDTYVFKECDPLLVGNVDQPNSDGFKNGSDIVDQRNIIIKKKKHLEGQKDIPTAKQ